MSDFIGMTEAAGILQVATGAVARRVLLDAGVKLEKLSSRVLIVRRSDVEALAEKRGGKVEKGRPAKKEKETADA